MNKLYNEDIPDHEGVIISCDPNYEKMNKKFSLSSGSKSIVQRCLNG